MARLEAGSNRPRPAKPQHPTLQRDAADLVLARIYPEGNVPSRLTGTMIYDKFRPRTGEHEAPLKIDRPPKAGEEETLIIGADIEPWLGFGHEPKRAMAR
jgi:hypothetical protein